MNRYVYSGPVNEFGKCIARRWEGATYAPSEAKARSNLTYQFKKENNKLPGTKITLPGKIELITRKERV
jgi:hypothetical protein